MPKRKNQKVVRLKPESDMILATCMNCHGTFWYIHIDRPGKDFSRITSFQCANRDCGMTINADIPLRFGK